MSISPSLLCPLLSRPSLSVSASTTTITIAAHRSNNFELEPITLRGRREHRHLDLGTFRQGWGVYCVLCTVSGRPPVTSTEIIVADMKY